MTDAQMLQNLMTVYEAMVIGDYRFFELQEVIAELRRRLEKRP